MASIETISVTGEISPGLNGLLKGIPEELSREELQNVVASIKSTYKGNFEAQSDQDLYSCLLLLQKQGHVTEQNLTLLERFVAPMASRKEEIKQRIKEFKELRQNKFQPRDELKGRRNDVQRILAKLISRGQPIINLYGSSGVGKTTLAKEICSTWQWKRIIVDLREVSEMEDVYFHLMLALDTAQTVRTDEANPVIAQIQQLKQNTQGDILLLLDNVDQFAGGNEILNANFIGFLERLLGPKSERDKTSLKILLTSRNQFPDSQAVDNYEVKGLEKSISGELIGPGGILGIGSSEMENLVEMCKGTPLFLNAMAAILRQEQANPEQLLRTEIQKPAVPLPVKEKPERETFVLQKEGIDEQQHSCLRKILIFLPSEQLKNAAVSMSLFCRPFSLEDAATVLGVDSLEAAILLEGLRNSQVLSVDPEAKDLLYDIHPLMQIFLRSIGNSRVFKLMYQKASERFCNLFIGRIKDIAGLLDKDYITAYNRFDFDSLNFELALEIFFKSDHLLIQREHQEIVMIAYLFEAMLDEKQRRKIFNSWAMKAKEDGKEGSIIGAELRCREALQVLRLDGWHKAKEVLKLADDSLSKVQEEYKTSDLYSLTRSSYLYTEGEVYYEIGNTTRALESLQASLTVMEDLLKNHTSTTKCLNAIGNCYKKLHKFDEALDYYTRAYDMREELSGSKKHFDMPLFKGQIGKIYEGKKQYEEALKFYQEALEQAEELNISGILYKALLYRNIADTYAWMKDFDAAYKPAVKAYEITKDVLGIHPHTARSVLFLADCCKSSEDFVEAKEFYAVAWKIEKSLGQGNHSGVRDRIVVSYERILEKERKEEFRKEALEFYERIWDEEKAMEGFEFSHSNRAIIDSIYDRVSDLGDKQLVKKYEREALWFYEGAWDSAQLEQRSYFVMTVQDRKDILYKLQMLASNLGNEKKTKKYEKLLEKLKRAEKSWTSPWPFEETVPQYEESDDDDDESDNGDDQEKFPPQQQKQNQKQQQAPQMPTSALRTKDCSSITSQTNFSLTSAPLEFQEHDNPSSPSNKKLQVTLLADEWGSSKGSLSTINRELAIHLAKHPIVEVTFLLPHCSDQDKEEARQNNVSIVIAKERAGFEPQVWLSFPPTDLAIDMVIGHGVELGRQAPIIRDSHECKWAQVVHKDPEELGMHKSNKGAIYEGEQKHQTEVELCEQADLVVAIGPKLTEKVSSDLRSCRKDQNVFSLIPGIFMDFFNVKQASQDLEKFRVLVFGRGDPEDFSLKGLDIAAKAVAELKDKTYQLLFVGAPEENQDEVTNKLLEFIPKDQLTVRGYVQTKQELKKLFCMVDLAIMPSRTEGFGLTALEALSAGLPILVSGNSGLGEALQKVLSGSSCVVESKDASDWAKAIKCVRKKKRDLRLKEVTMLREHYAGKYSWEEQCERIVKRMWNLVDDYDDHEKLPPQQQLQQHEHQAPQNTPVEFFGIPLDDQVLLEAPVTTVLSACLPVLESVRSRGVYKEYQFRSEKYPAEAVLSGFFGALARLQREAQDQCFNSIMSALGDEGQGVQHIIERLREANFVVSRPCNDIVRDIVVEQTMHSWRRLARFLDIRDAVIDAIQVEENEDEERCRLAIRRWRQSNGENATIRVLMIALTKAGRGNVNLEISRHLELIQDD